MKLVKKILKTILKNRFHFKLLNSLLDFFYPQFCFCCSSPGYQICPSCFTKLEEKSEKRDPCKICGINLKKQKCSCKKGIKKDYSQVFSLFDFDKTIKSIVHQFKYNGLHSVASDLAGRFNYLIPDELIDDIDLVVPVPLHLYRKMNRGYNQAEVIAKDIIPQKFEIPIINILKRKRSTGTQTILSKDKRETNLKGAFSVSKKYKNYLKGKVVLLVDDVITTGATCNICSKVLLNAGAREVRLLSLARA